ncbi:ACT domain-containing protein [Bacillus sp. DJP31]|uniref:ACT domain-containing protein n=1 Tax=Bacillus sp. DJP31 TaxID=3409789 RepID=UPI003BB6BD70
MDKEKYYLIRGDILPESIYKTVEAKKLLESGEVETINHAVEKVGISRSAYYKYKDKIFPFNAATYQQIITISLILEHKSGVLSMVLRFVADKSGNVLTINQSIPLQGIANVVLSVDTALLNLPTTEFLEELQQINGVKKVVVVGQG